MGASRGHGEGRGNEDEADAFLSVAAVEIGEAQVVADRQAPWPPGRVQDNRRLARARSAWIPRSAPAPRSPRRRDAPCHRSRGSPGAVDHGGVVQEPPSGPSTGVEPIWIQSPCFAARSRQAAMKGSAAAATTCCRATSPVAVHQPRDLRQAEKLRPLPAGLRRKRRDRGDIGVVRVARAHLRERGAQGGSRDLSHGCSACGTQHLSTRHSAPRAWPRPSAG
jgi:hypothetical protein